jgi:uncharacterized membrane protein YeaQ/YmgE (transglycosylase-associated protein family)
MSFMDFFAGVDVYVCLVIGAVAGWLAFQFMRGWSFGLIANIVIGMVGAVISGLIFDWANIMDVGDLLDPLIAGAIGAAVLLGIAGLLRPQPVRSHRQRP